MRIVLLLFWCVLAAAAQQPYRPETSDPKYKLFGATTAARTASTRVVQGIVINKNGQPVKGAVVRLHNMRTGKVKYVTTKEDGAYVFTELASNIDYHIHAARGDSRSRSHTLSALDDSPRIILNLRLEGATVPKEKAKPK
jgi:hypothetical protein